MGFFSWFFVVFFGWVFYCQPCLEVELQRDNLVKFDAGNTTDEAFRHALVLANVEVLNVVELRVSGGLQRSGEVVLLRRIVVDGHAEVATLVVALDKHVMILARHEVLLREDQLLPFESKVEDETDMSRIRHHQREKLLAHVRFQSDEEPLRIGRRETHMDPLGNRRLVLALEVVFDHVVGAHVDADFVGADGALEGGPAAVAVEGIVALQAFAAVEAGVVAALTDAAGCDAVQAPGFFGHLAY